MTFSWGSLGLSVRYSGFCTPRFARPPAANADGLYGIVCYRAGNVEKLVDEQASAHVKISREYSPCLWGLHAPTFNFLLSVCSLSFLPFCTAATHAHACGLDALCRAVFLVYYMGQCVEFSETSAGQYPLGYSRSVSGWQKQVRGRQVCWRSKSDTVGLQINRSADDCYTMGRSYVQVATPSRTTGHGMQCVMAG